jgi:hypothetical protein
VNVSDSYSLNNAVQLSLKDNPQDFNEMNVDDDFWLWFGNFIDNFYT